MKSDVSVSPKESKEGEEAQNGKGVTKPKEPTKKEWDEHMLTHVPYRNWCPFCVKGRGRQDAHKTEKGEEKKVAGLVMDYAFLNPEEKETNRPILMMKDQRGGKVMAFVVTRKGEEPKAIMMTAREIRRLGYGEMIWKSDQEPSIMALKERVR